MVRYGGVLYYFSLLTMKFFFAGASLGFITSVFRTILGEQTIEQFGRMLINAGMDEKLIEFFPPNKREEECLARHFEAEDIKQLVAFYEKNQLEALKTEMMANLKKMMSDKAEPTEVEFHLVSGQGYHEYD